MLRRVNLLTLCFAVLSLLANGSGLLLAADKTAAKRAGQVAGILVERKDSWITVKVDGEQEPVKYSFAANSPVGEAMKNIFNASRVQLTYKTAGDERQLTGISRQILQETGTVTGVVVKVYDKFWVEVQPRRGVANAFAPNFDKEMIERVNALEPGDSVTIQFTTDGERHRIAALRKNPPPPAKSDAKPKKTTPAKE